MALFQKSVLNKYLKALDPDKVNEAYQKFTAFFHNEQIIQNIREDKEEQFQYGFLQKLFDEVLDYTINPNPDFNITTEFKNLKGSKKADGAILKDGKAIGVIELKSTNTKELNKITDQAFGYKNNHPSCVYVITSNFEKLRFYINDAVEFLDFDLFTINEERFKVLYLCLQRDHILNDLPQRIKKESVLQEEEVTKKLYKDYSAFKNALFADLANNNPQFDKLALYKRTQKLLDRLLFIFFAEDIGLLPPNSISDIIKQWEQLSDLDEYRPLYDRYKKYFGYLNEGREQDGKFVINAFNGGLFEPDEILDNVKISDGVLMNHSLALSKYDFESEVDVNILGHIFEHSLNEIEEITAELEGQTIDKKQSKRKKDGVFYTPKYITKYIVDNTVGKLCEEKKAALNITEEEYRAGRTKAKKKSLLDQLEEYRKYLLSLTICDPACGSGAFLNQALDFLIKEHHYIDELQARLLGEAIVFPDISSDILEKNIYGVDINEEAIDIAKLSLWLRTAKKGRTLTTLSNNIKCGNSLIGDPQIADKKAFNWEKEFPEVFKNGGFDVVIGNPPYVRPRNFDENQKKYLIKTYKSIENQFDLYHIFIEKSEELRNKKGLASMILPNAFLANENSQLLRKYILENCKIQQIVDCKQEVFKDASVDVLIYVFDSTSSVSDYFELNKNVFEFKHQFKANNFLKNKNYNFTPTLNLKATELFQKIKTTTEELGDYYDVMSGIKEYQTGKGQPPQTPEDKLERRFNSNTKIDETYVKEVRGKHLNCYFLDWKDEYISYGKWLAEPRNPEFFTGNRFLIRQIPAKESLVACYTNEDYIVDQTAYIVKPKNESVINHKGVLGILNSKLIFWFYRNENNEFDNLFPKIKAKEIRALPLKTNVNWSSISENVNSIESKTLELSNTASKFSRTLIRKFTLENLSKNLQTWHTLTYTEFIKELKKQKIILSLSEEAEWEDYFEQEKAKVQAIQTEIDKTDKEIDRMVYELYGLTEEEIAIVEGSIK